MERVSYIFCHGLNGSGSYDAQYAKRPYWGGRSGDVVARLRERGYDAYAASVAPQGSAWDRACELYAQLAGTVTDYGAAHAEAYRHERFGPDFSGRALIGTWDDNTRLVLIGHSLGGVTVRLLSELLARGSDEERTATPARDLSPLFAGGLDARVRAIVTLAAPSNGTVAYDLALDDDFDPKQVKVPLRHRMLDRLVKAKTKIKGDGRDERDWADFDMLLDNARAINEKISVLSHVYYLSQPLDATMPGQDGTCVPDPALMDPLFVRSSALIGCYSGTTEGGQVIDDAWHANDGLVSTVSEYAPFADPQRPLDTGDVRRGVWNVMPVLRANHSFFQGGFLKRQDPFPYFLDLMQLLDGLA